MLSLRRRLNLASYALEERIAPATLPTGFAESSVGAASSGTAMAFSPDGKLYVLEQVGRMKVFEGSGTTWNQVAPGTAPNQDFFQGYFTTAPLRINSSNERGLLGIAFDPNYTTNRYLYVYYTSTATAIHNRVSRFEANANGTQVVAGTETVLMDLENLSAGNHNGGAIHFGPDGKLYVAVGENAVMSNSQSLNNRLGKMLRLNPDPANPIPSDNPTSFPNIAGSPTGVNRAIWAVGLRNPFTFAFQPGTNRMYINDVGAGTWEEVNNGVAGANYGWSGIEGPNPAGVSDMTYPFLYYHHSNTSLAVPTPGYTGTVIVGATFYNPTSYTFPSDYVNDFFFADAGFSSSFIRRYDYTSNTVTSFATGAGSPVDLLVGPDGALYYLSRGSGQVFRVRATSAIAPYIVTPPANRTVDEGDPVTFTATAGGSGTLTYQWQRNNVNIAGATAASYTIASTPYSDNNATYRVIVSNGTLPNATSNPATLTVNPNPPTITSVTFGDGSNQRSMVKQIVVTFSESVNFTGLVASAFTVRRTGTGNPIQDADLTATPANGPATTVTITFNGALSEFGSLVDGIYDFTASAGLISGIAGALDGNNDQIPGGNYSVVGSVGNRFFRYFGDANGDGNVTQETDFIAFRNAFASSNSIFDFNDNGTIDQDQDFFEFRDNFGLTP